MFIQNKYTKCYFSIISNARARLIDQDVYYEKHHILPKSCGGDNSSQNLVKLTAREHFICHKLLTKMLVGKEKNKMVHALWRMCNSLKSEYKITARSYRLAREEHVDVLKTVGTSGQFKKGRTTWNKGVPRTVEVKQAISNANKGSKRPGRTSESFTAEWRAKISLSALTREKKVCPYCNKSAGPTNFVRWHGNNCRSKN